jgi:predicted RNA methylase
MFFIEIAADYTDFADSKVVFTVVKMWDVFLLDEPQITQISQILNGFLRGKRLMREVQNNLSKIEAILFG